MTTATYPRLLADVGGTNARFAWASRVDSPLSEITSYPCRDHDSLHAAISSYLDAHGKPAPRACAIGIANPVTSDQVRMTNHHWSFSIAQLKADLAVSRLAVVNDFTALALSLPALRPTDLRAIGGGVAVGGEPMGVIGPGTGLGVSGLLPSADGSHMAMAGEGGHATLAPADDEESAVLALLRERFGHVSAERALSGPGLVNLYRASASLAGRAALDLSPAEVIERARQAQSDADARAAIDLFCRFLGSMAGNLALTLGARGGIFIGGGIAPRLLPELAASRFRERFEGKGRLRDYLAQVPTLIIEAKVSPALIGASRALEIDKFCLAG